MERLERLKRLELSAGALRFLRSARVAHLATADRKGQPLVIPICYALDVDRLYSPIDEKPKKGSPLSLKRLRNIRENARVSVVVDRYEDDWKRLGYVLITGKARILAGGKSYKRAVDLLRKKYPQYRRMAIDQRPIIQINPSRVISWGAL